MVFIYSTRMDCLFFEVWTSLHSLDSGYFFVGIPRAKRRLILTHADQRDRPAGRKKMWNVARTPQEEYFNYAAPFLDPEV